MSERREDWQALFFHWANLGARMLTHSTSFFIANTSPVASQSQALLFSYNSCTYNSKVELSIPPDWWFINVPSHFCLDWLIDWRVIRIYRDSCFFSISCIYMRCCLVVVVLVPVVSALTFLSFIHSECVCVCCYCCWLSSDWLDLTAVIAVVVDGYASSYTVAANRKSQPVLCAVEMFIIAHTCTTPKSFHWLTLSLYIFNVGYKWLKYTFICFSQRPLPRREQPRSKSNNKS